MSKFTSEPGLLLGEVSMGVCVKYVLELCGVLRFVSIQGETYTSRYVCSGVS